MSLIDYFIAADDTVAATLGTLESIMTGCSYDAVTDQPRHCHPITDASQEAFVVTVTDTMRDALAHADAGHLSAAARAWARTDELRGVAAQDLLKLLEAFAALARRAVEHGQRLYCWTDNGDQARRMEAVPLLADALVSLVHNGLVEVRAFSAWPAGWDEGVTIPAGQLADEVRLVDNWLQHDGSSGLVVASITDAGGQWL
jgi:hypothetical protein